MKKTSRIRGFTLLEVMIAIFIFSFVMTAIYSCWHTVLRSTKLGLDEATRVQRQRMTIRVIVDALVSAQLFNQNIAHYAFITDTSSDFAYLSLVSRLPESFPRGGIYGDQRTRRVTFSVENSAVSKAQLVMYQEPVLADPESDSGYGSLVLAQDISLFALEFWDLAKREWIAEWAHTNQLPQFVRISLGFGDIRQSGDVFSRVVAIPAMAVPRDYQMPIPPPAPPGARPGPGGQPGNPNQPPGVPGGGGVAPPGIIQPINPK